MITYVTEDVALTVAEKQVYQFVKYLLIITS